MTTKRNPKIEQYGDLENFYEISWSKQSVTTYNQAQKSLNKRNYLNILFSEFELHGDDNESKTVRQLKKILF